LSVSGFIEAFVDDTYVKTTPVAGLLEAADPRPWSGLPPRNTLVTGCNRAVAGWGWCP
jgi:hypothetical protein